jgi:hypothetical protein
VTTRKQSFAVWTAEPIQDSPGMFHPWDITNHTIPSSDPENVRWWRRQAHRWAREDRQLKPGCFVAVREHRAGRPLPVAGMVPEA